MQASKVPWYKHDSHHAVHQITKASSWQQKQKAIDAYMDKKVQANATTDQNIASLQQNSLGTCPAVMQIKSWHAAATISSTWQA